MESSSAQAEAEIENVRHRAMINISKLNKVDVLCALYSASAGHGGPRPLDRETAKEVLGKSSYVDYLIGRVIKVNFATDLLNPIKYDRDNGTGAALRAIEPLYAPA